MSRIPEAVEQSERVKSWRFILKVMKTAGPVEVAQMLRDAGFAVNEAGEIIEKIGECETCGLHTYVKRNPAGRFVCINCLLNELEAGIENPSGAKIPEDNGAAGALPGPKTKGGAQCEVC